MTLAAPLCTLLALALAAPAQAGEVYARIPVPSIEITSGELPVVSPNAWADQRQVSATLAYVVLEGTGEAFIALDDAAQTPNMSWRVSDPRLATLAVRLPEPRAVRGRLCVPEADAAGMRQVGFSIPAAAFSGEGREAFLEAEALHYEDLLARNLPGAAWFRHRAVMARRALGHEVLASPRAAGPLPWGEPRGDADETYELFTGGRAVAENLQLDRELWTTLDAQATVELGSIPGIATAEYDWAKETQGLDPELDPLARWIPADQHAVFFPSFEALISVLDELDQDGTPILQLFEARAEDARTRARYERQLCLPLDQRARALGPLVIDSVALTGSDPYLRTGSDVALLFRTNDPHTMYEYVQLEQRRAQRANPGAILGCPHPVSLPGPCIRTPDRSVCSHLARLDDHTLVVTNSPAQLERLAAVESGEAKALSAAPEYRFFRHRYPLGEEGEEALLVLTDASIRRWCAPRWRIGAARRTQAAAWLADAQAAFLAFDAGLADAPPERFLPDGGELTWDVAGARSPKWGTVEFLTPIAELDLERVTPEEKTAYERFRDRYQAGWRAWFDPIAVRLSRSGDVLEADMTVRPLIAGSDYREWMEIVGRATLAPLAADPHPGTLVHFAMAVDTKAEPFAFASGLLSGGRDGTVESLFGWLGDGVGLYVEPDPFFDAWRTAGVEDEGDAWLEDHLSELPLVLQVESKDPLRLAFFLTTLRAFVQQSGPELLAWETKEHAGRSYVRIGAAEEMRDSLGEAGRIEVWYASLPDALIVTLREDLLLRALERRETRSDEGEPVGPPWLGQSLALRADDAVLDLIRDLAGDHELRRQQALAWSALPILREWRRLFPDQDPLALHERFFGMRLVDPGGGEYVWDESWASHASTRYGHPGAPLAGPIWPSALERVAEIDLGITFEQDGLRARARLRRD